MSQKISSLSRSNSSSSSKHDSRQDSWEIVEGLRGGQCTVQDPQKQEGFMMKKRKWPMKGWHKRYFFLDKGILKYAKCAADIDKGKLHGRIDVGLSVMAIKKKAKCIDLDAEENIYHLKVNHNACGCSAHFCFCRCLTHMEAGFGSFGHNIPNNLCLSLSLSSELSSCEAQLLELSHLLQSMEVLHRTYSAPAITALKKKESVLDVQNVHLSLLMYIMYIACLHQKEDSTDGSRPLVHQISNESRASITESLSEFFDAQEVLLSASSSENEASEGDSYISDISDNISMDNLSTEVENERLNSGGAENGGPLSRRRRSCLPSPSPNTNNISLWNILKNNIGKDLSKVAMPVQLNEPLNTLQRLCEELEYSELLDRAANTADPYERMVYIATFAVSGYASSYHRAGGKPFNPVLGETYECDRPDKGFRFVAEQVSHHPPISACHAESKNFIFRQDMRWKNKFWGKSMEIVPIGTSHVVLPGFGDHYEWNKVTSCIHNILSGQRWIEHYGEISIKNSNSDACQCKVTFIKAKYWNSSVNEVQGTVLDQKGNIVHTLFGKWHEAMFCGDPPSANCVWRANSVPQNHEQYYGFTKFAIELNELKPEMKQLLPPTDTRLRPDQRLLEEGNVEGAEEQKQHIEQLQRDRRRVLEENNMIHQPRFFQKSQNDMWVSNNTYWDLRKEPGFSHLDCPVLW
uniref:Oxysterol-binding protein n=1 Tax=Denticeps clupeoides TaxID=299321 RepID=A0AAY4A7G0_9TELE